MGVNVVNKKLSWNCALAFECHWLMPLHIQLYLYCTMWRVEHLKLCYATLTVYVNLKVYWSKPKNGALKLKSFSSLLILG